MEGLGFVAARQHLDAARPVATLLVERRPRLAESKYAMDNQAGDSKTLSPPWSLDLPDSNTAGSSDEDARDDRDERKEDNDDDEDSQVGFHCGCHLSF